MKSLFLALLLAVQAATPKIVLPSYPWNAFRGGNVVAAIEQTRNHLKVSILHAEEPFVEPVREALGKWQLPGGSEEERNAVVVVNFRDWFDIENSENGIKQNPAIHGLQWPQSQRPLPVPTMIIDPLYPELTLTMSASIAVRLKVSPKGTITDVDVIQGMDEFNQAVVEAVKKWRFLPARNESGDPVESEAYAICVYRPLLNPTY